MMNVITSLLYFLIAFLSQINLFTQNKDYISNEFQFSESIDAHANILLLNISYNSNTTYIHDSK